DLPLDPAQREFVDSSRDELERGARMRRRALGGALAAALCAVAGLGWGLYAYRVAARDARRAEIARVAAEHPDPMVGALALVELAREGEPVGGAAAAVEIARK